MGKAKKGFRFGRAACGQGSNASKDGDLSENPGSIPCTVPSTASTEAQNPWSRRRQRPGRPPTAQLYLELSFFCLLAQINPRNLASGWMCGRRVGPSHLHRRLSLSGVEAIKKIFTACMMHRSLRRASLNSSSEASSSSKLRADRQSPLNVEPESADPVCAFVEK